MATPFDNLMTPPAQNKEAFKRLKAAKDMQMQAAVGAAQPPLTPGQAAPGADIAGAQALGGAAAKQTGTAIAGTAAQQGQQALQGGNLALQAAIGQKQTQQAQAQLGQQTAQAEAQMGQQAALTREQRDAQQNLSDKEIEANERLSRFGIETDNNLSFLNRAQREQLAELGSDVKQQLFDSRLQFAKDEGGRRFTNERQLADFAVSSAQNKIDLANKLGALQNAADRDMKLATTAHNRIVEALKNGSLDRQREMTQAQKMELENMRQAAERAMRRKKARAANTRAIITGAATIAVVVATGGTAGAAIAAGGASGLAAQQQGQG